MISVPPSLKHLRLPGATCKCFKLGGIDMHQFGKKNWTDYLEKEDEKAVQRE